MKRWMGRILLCLFLGAVATVAVAWGFAFFVDPGEAPMTRYIVYSTTCYFEVDDALDQSVRIECFAIGYDIPGGRVLGWLSLGDGATPDAFASHAETIVAYPPPTWLFPPVSRYRDFTIGSGWPCLALRSGTCATAFVTGPGGNAWRSRSAIVCGMHDSRIPRAIPYGIVWPGFLIDTLFYAAIWFGVFFAPGMAKRAIRRARGRCPMCGYDLRGHRHQGIEASRHQGIGPGCPECGWNREGIEASRDQGIKDGAP